MIAILTPEEATALDRASAARGVGVDALMERAGFEVARAAVRLAGGAYGRRAVVVCGTGNNGGDGLVAARHLDRWGMGVTAMLLAARSAYIGQAAANLRRLLHADVRILGSSGPALAQELVRADVAVDAIFGTGFHGVAEGRYAEAIAALGTFGASGAPVVAVDIPSGVNGATAAADGPAVAADLTVTFGGLKPGVVFLPGAELAGRVEVADIGFPSDLVRSDAAMLEPADAAALLPRRGTGANKRSEGIVLVIAGSGSMPGAATLATLGAYRTGAGLVTLAGVPRAVEVAQGHVVDAVFVRLPETADGWLAEGAWPQLERQIGAAQAVAIGPGLGRHRETAALVRRVVASTDAPVVVDADGLNAFPEGGGLASRAGPAVLTPHAGEFERLTGVDPRDVATDRIGHARVAAASFGCVVLLKGPRTVVARPPGRATINPTGGPALATGGTGDVLTGVIAALLARGLDPGDAAALGAYVHGLAGDLASAELGEGTTARDVAERLPLAARSLAALRDEAAPVRPRAPR